MRYCSCRPDRTVLLGKCLSCHLPCDCARLNVLKLHLDDVYDVEEVAEDGVLHGTPDEAVVGQGEHSDEPVRRPRPVQIVLHEDHAWMQAGVWCNIHDDIAGVEVMRL